MHFSVTRFSPTGLGDAPWEAPPPLPPRALPARCDVVVVGAGITGLAAALSLANRQRDVVVVEQAFGTGVTCRSGGMVIGETSVGPALGFEGCERALRDWIVARGIECELTWNACLELARDRTLPAHPIDWKDDGPIRMAAEVSGGVLYPSKFLAGLAAVVGRAGVPIVDGVTVRSMEPGSREITLRTNRSSIVGHQVVMATDATAWTDASDPWEERAITVALQTTPIEPDVLTSIGLHHHHAFYTRDLPLLWGRLMRDRSLLVGRELFPFPWRDSHPDLTQHTAAAGARLLSRARRLHPAASNLGAQRVWAGPIGKTTTGVPTIVRDPENPHLCWVGGYGGHGLAQAFRLGSLVGEYLDSSSVPL